MPFPASNGALSDALERACRVALQMKATAEREAVAMAAGTVPATTVVDLYRQLRTYRAALANAAGTPGIVPYAQAQLGDDQMDVAAEFGAMLDALDGCTGWIAANFPKDAGGYLLAFTLPAGTDRPVDRQFTPAQTAGLCVQLTGLAATVN